MRHHQPSEVTAPIWPLHFRDADKKEATEKTQQCISWLQAQGFEVQYAYLTPRNPRITIRHTPLCDQLEGAVRRYERVGNNAQHYWVAVRFDCEVRWQEGGAA